MNAKHPKPHRLPPDPTPEQMAQAYAEGLLRKDALEHGRYYAGYCRNARIARWHAGAQAFVYLREKFGQRFPEKIRHPEDERRYDAFMVLEALPESAVPLDVRIEGGQFEQGAQGLD